MLYFKKGFLLTLPMNESSDSPSPQSGLGHWLSRFNQHDLDSSARIEAASKMAESSDIQALTNLLDALRQECDARVLMHVISLMARKQVYQAVMPLIDLVLLTGDTRFEQQFDKPLSDDACIRVRVAAVQALGKMRDQRAIVPLMDTLNNQRENYRIRLAAAESLGRMGDAQALSPLVDVVQNDQETSHYVKESAVKALGMLGDIRALDPLLDVFEAKKGFKDKFAFLKEQIIEAIGRIGSRQNKAVKVLLESLDDEASHIRMAAIESLAEVGDESCIVALTPRLLDAEDDVALAAVAAIYQLGGEVAVRDILATMDNLPQFVRDELECYVP